MSQEEFEAASMAFAAGQMGRRQFLKLDVAGGIGVLAATAVAGALAPAHAAPPGGSIYGNPPPGKGGIPPGRGGTPPGLGGGTSPGHGGTPPGQGGLPPGQFKQGIN